MNQIEHEQALIRAFVVAEKRERLMSLLANPKRRQKILDTLFHFNDLDERFVEPLPPSAQNMGDIVRRLRRYGAPDTCWVISTDETLDGRELPLDEVLYKIVGGLGGHLVSCVPGEPGYFEGEWPKDRCILRREPGRAQT